MNSVKPRVAAVLGTICVAMLSGVLFVAPAYAAGTPSPNVSASASASPSPSETIGTAPNAPQDIKWAQTGRTSVKLSWTAPAADATHDAATSYVVQTSANGQAMDQGKKVTGTSVSYTGIDANTVLTTTVTALNAYGASENKAGPTWTQPAAAPDAPDSVSIGDVGASSFKVSWTAPADDGGSAVSAYVVKVYKNSALYYSQTLDVVSTTDSFTGLPRGATYRVDVFAVNKVGQSEAASSRDVKISAPTASSSSSTSTAPSSVPPSPTATKSQVSQPSPTDSQLQQELNKVREQQAAIQRQQQNVINWVVLSVLAVLLAGAITALIVVIRYNRRVDAYNHEHGYDQPTPPQV